MTLRDVTPHPLRRRSPKNPCIATAAACWRCSARCLRWASPAVRRPRRRHPGSRSRRSRRKAGFRTAEELTRELDATTYNNFYEFGTNKDDPAKAAKTLRTSPWTVAVGGQCAKPGKLSLEDLIKGLAPQERIYRMRCVEGWSMVIPWLGVPLGDVLKRFEPTSKAKYVAFTSLADPRQMPGVRSPSARLAVPRGPAHRRGDASADPAGHRHVRQDAAAAERRAVAAGGAVEVRLQGDQVDHRDHLRRAHAEDLVEHVAGRRSTGSSPT